MNGPNRREVLAGGAAAFALGGVSVSFAAAPTDRRLVVLLLRGGPDGMALVPPHGDPAYRDVRGRLALPGPEEEGGVLDLDGFFGLHPSAAGLVRFWRRGELAILPAAATPYRGRLHAEAQEVLENGTASPGGAQTGWLARAVGLLGGASAFALHDSLPPILHGPGAAEAWTPPALPQAIPGFFEKASQLYLGDAVLGPALARSMRDREAMLDALPQDDRLSGRGAGRPQDLGHAAALAGARLAGADGPRIAVIETGGWDTHREQGALTGRLARRIAGLADGVFALTDALGDAWSQTVVVAAGEFGRSAAPNAGGGTGHGLGGLALVLGGPVNGGGIVGDWPGLAPDRLAAGGGLRPTVDLRSVFKAVLAGHMGLPDGEIAARVFPDSGDAPILSGLLKG